MPHRSQACDMVTGVKRICRVDKKESPFLVAVLLGKEGAGHVHCTLDPSLKAGAKLRISACILGLGAR